MATLSCEVTERFPLLDLIGRCISSVVETMTLNGLRTDNLKDYNSRAYTKKHCYFFPEISHSKLITTYFNRGYLNSYSNHKCVQPNPVTIIAISSSSVQLLTLAVSDPVTDSYDNPQGFTQSLQVAALLFTHTQNVCLLATSILYSPPLFLRHFLSTLPTLPILLTL
jgi:hypothetical protein